MDNKDFVNLLLKEIREMSLLCESLSEIDEIPSSLLSLSKEKADSMSSILGTLIEKKKNVRGAEEKIEVQSVEEAKTEKQEEKTVVSPVSHETKKEIAEEKTTKIEEFPQKKEDETEVKSNFGTIVVDEKKEGRTDSREKNSDIKEKPENIAPDKQGSSVRVPKKKLSAESRFVKSLKLCLGDKFRYKKELFNDDMELLNVTMSELDQLNSLEEAFAYVERFGWNEENPAVEDFFDLLQSRFS